LDVINRVLVDAGAIVGALSQRDQNFAKAGPKFRFLPKPFYTCEPVITEALFLMKSESGGKEKTLGLLSQGILQLDFSLGDQLEAVRALMKKYDSVPMSLADACLVRMSELNNSQVFTFDSDFRIYRRFGRQRIPLIGLE
jgi:predicted nucleic acid-binding protein